MPAPYTIPLWKSSPFVRLILPLIAGIIFHWYMQPAFMNIIICSAIIVSLFTIFRFLPLHVRFRFQQVSGLLLNAVIFCFAFFLCYKNDIRNNRNWFGRNYNDSSALIIRITGPPVEKERSFKAEAVAEQISNGNVQDATGKILLYFAKDSGRIPLYGDRILIRGGLQRIKNSGNPGAFDYEQYMRLQNIFHHCYLHTSDYILLPRHYENPLYSFIFSARKKILNILKQNIKGDKKVTGVDEAMFIGYKEDLDKDEVQAYRNGGVVHIIIIAGMHLGLISALLIWFFAQLKFLRRLPVLKIISIICCLWLFALITGASVPVLRSAVMFTCIIIGRHFFKKPDTYNSLAASAFILLCCDPFLLWDAGFQMSYCAVIGIVWLQKPIAKLWYTPNSILQKVWELCSLSLAAQSLILPLCIYYFHTIPLLFLLTNLLCVPIFTIVLFGEILMVIISPVAIIANVIGKSIYVLTRLMNFIIDACNAVPFSLISNIYSSVFTTAALYGFIIFCSHGLMKKTKELLKISSVFLILFIVCWSYTKISSLHQKKMVIYHVPHQTAIDFISGNQYSSFGDNLLRTDLQASRLFFGAEEKKDSLNGLKRTGNLLLFYDKKIMIIDSSIQFEPLTSPVKTDVLLLCRSPKISLKDILSAVSPALVVIDGSNSLWKIGQFKKECEQLHLRSYITAEEGAFILGTNKK